MKLLKIIQILLISGSVWVLLANNVKSQDSQTPVESGQINSQTVTEVVEVTGVKLAETNKGIELIIETTAARKLQVLNRSQGKNFIAEIPNAQLKLSEKNVFSQINPVDGISEVIVTNKDKNSIQIKVVGESNLPKVELFDSNQALIFALSPVTNTVQKPTPKPSPTESQQEPIELIVTGERDGYRVPNATTGTRIDTAIRDIPQSIQVVPQEILKDQQVTRLDEALRNVSGVIGNSSEGGGFQFSIRGFERARTMKDGFSQSPSSVSGSGILTLPETANLERIEVLKGPASILYGEVQPGGTINLVTKKPTSEPLYEAELQIGSRGFVQPRIDFSDALTPDKNVRYRLNALIQNDEGFRDFDQNIQRQFIAPIVTWNINEKTDLTFNFEYLHDKRPYDTGLVAFGDGIIDVPRSRIVNEPDDFNEKDFLSTGYSFEHRFNDNWLIRNAFRFSNQQINQNVFAPLGFDEATGNVNRANAATEWLQNDIGLQTNVVGKFETGSIKHTLLFGVDWNRDYSDIEVKLNLAQPSILNIFNPVYGSTPRLGFDEIPILGRSQEVRTSKLGLFLQDQIAFSDNLKLLAGLRYDTIEQKQTSNPSFLDRTGSESTQNPDALIPRLGIVYQPIPEMSLYASYSRSFTPNSGVTTDGDFLEPEEGEGYEIGVKSELFKDRLFATLAYYDITKKNIASPDPRFPNLAGVSVATGEQRSRGIELDLTGKISPGWDIIASYSYTDAEVTEDNVTPIGNKLVGIPEHSASLWTTYTIQQGDLEGLGLGIGFNYVGNRKGDLANTFDLGSYFLTNAAFFYKKDNWRAALNFKNIFDVNYVQGAPFSRFRNIEPGAPFTVIGSVSVKF
ncbi:MAG: TonB-dependent receptor [Cyanobacteria bacterium J06621_15]